MADIGEPVREVTIEPLEEPSQPIPERTPTPAPATTPTEPAPAAPQREPEEVPA